MKGNTPVPRLKNHRIVVNQAWCKKCGICIAFCAKGVLAWGMEGWWNLSGQIIVWAVVFARAYVQTMP
nr:hypothetical protein [Desulforamulus aquiferis]